MLGESERACHTEGTACESAWRHEIVWWTQGKVSCSAVLVLEYKMMREMQLEENVGARLWKYCLYVKKDGPTSSPPKASCNWERKWSHSVVSDSLWLSKERNFVKSKINLLCLCFFLEFWRGKASGLVLCTGWGLSNCLESQTWCIGYHDPHWWEMQESEAWDVNFWCQQK